MRGGEGEKGEGERGREGGERVKEGKREGERGREGGGE